MSPTERDAAAVRILPPLIPLGFVLLGVGLEKLVPIPVPLAAASPFLRGTAGVLGMGGALLCLWAIAVLVRTGQDPSPMKPTPSIVETGPFRLSRNPIYLGLMLISLAFALRLPSVWLLLLLPVCGWALVRWVIRPEEVYLDAKFGERYRAYTQRVRRWV